MMLGTMTPTPAGPRFNLDGKGQLKKGQKVY